MELRTAVSPKDVKHYTTDRLREEFLIQNLFEPGQIKLVYSHIDRIITGAAVPVEPITLTAGDELRAEYFCQRRELGVINIGGAGTITVDGKVYKVGFKEAMYIGMGSRDIVFASEDAASPANPPSIWCYCNSSVFKHPQATIHFSMLTFPLLSSCSLVFLASFEKLLVSLYLLKIPASTT